ncbi:MAG TPA: hypothetical protein VKB03_10380 [Conexibacter sp.]|nr:hypothetical protein [Conexibacter sp.]
MTQQSHSGAQQLAEAAIREALEQRLQIDSVLAAQARQVMVNPALEPPDQTL